MKRKKLCKAMAQWLGLGVVGMHAAHAGNSITVDSIEDQPQVGLTTLREAIEESNTLSGAVIRFDATLFSTPQTITLQNGDLKINSRMTITGPGADLLTIDGNNLSRIMTIDSGSEEDIDVTVSGITLTRGNGASETNDGLGGCIFSFDNLSLIDSVVTECSARNDGGGFFSRSSELIIQNSVISNNSGVEEAVLFTAVVDVLKSLTQPYLETVQEKAAVPISHKRVPSLLILLFQTTKVIRVLVFG